ncbi:MAG: DNA-processing protein DprA [Erysipelotrichaceae bacterium]|nr:DNA-processing protein DprA [Erysipelotrichaceae bacterium]
MSLLREQLIGYAIKYQGDYAKIIRAFDNKEDYQPVDVKAITILDPFYPEKLRDLRLPPLVLFYKGNTDLLKREAVAVIGSRKMTEKGRKTTEYVTDHLKKRYVIVSGMAKGVDGVAHRFALDSGTIAVLGSGIDHIYPKENRDLYHALEKDHLIISEYPFDYPPYAQNFRFRNRIIAALSQAVYVTQAQDRSCTFITVNEALDLNREIYVAPYHLFDEEAYGSNLLISEGATLLTREHLDNICNCK